MQVLLYPEWIDLKILKELNLLLLDKKEQSTDSLGARVRPINLKLNLINKLLQVNQTAPSLQEYRKKAKEATSPWSLKDGLLKYQERLIVAKE